MPEIDLQKEHSRITAKLNQLKGKLEAAKARLETEYGLKSVLSANAALKEMRQEFQVLEAQYKEAYDDFIAKYGDKLGTL